MKLLKVELRNLFNIFNHTIELNQDERITIITAPNGYGKTIALKVIHNFFNKNFVFFNKLVFDSMTFYFDNEKSIKIVKNNTMELKKIDISIHEQNSKVITFEYPSKQMLSNAKKSIPTRIIEDLTPEFIKRIGFNEWFNETTGEKLSLEEVLYQFNEYMPQNILKKFQLNMNEEFESFFDAFRVYFIQEQRLVLRESSMSINSSKRGIVIIDSIEKYAKELSLQIKNNIDQYAQKTQTLDSSFPKRLFQENHPKLDTSNLKDRLSKLQDKRQKISKYGFLKLEDDNSLLNTDKIEESETKVLSLYLQDNEAKLSVFDTLINKIELFTNILNKRRFTFKSIEIDKDKGFVFKTHQDEPLQLTDLSSGEQHEVVLLFELLFKAEQNSLVLIDEPEISLHVVWQKAFVDDIKEIIELQKIDIVIATHSPYIIDDRWDLTVEFKAE